MTPEADPGASESRRREDAERIFLAALDKPCGEQEEFVRARCRGDAALERTVLSLLEAHNRPGQLDRMANEISRWQRDLLERATEPAEESTALETLTREPVAGNRYRIESLLGRGGIGEVWRAYDLKLELDVALKWLRDDLIEDRQMLDMLRREVRAAREVISPNVCRVFDLHEFDGRELIAMEYVDGTTLREILATRSPLDLEEARAIASQFLNGLEAIHDAGLVHSDIKPANLMITRTGRVVVMDFGIAQNLQMARAGRIAGTLAYMPPEQRAGASPEPRADLFAAGVVLAEMVDPAGVQSRETLEAIWSGIRQKVPQISVTPWSRVIARALSPDPEDRHPSAQAMRQALEKATLRAIEDDEASPYPGLSSFDRDDSRFFFGRELEIEAFLRKLEPARLLGIVGASGAGKSSFIRAGLLPSLPGKWSALVATPGDRPFVSLARALAEALPGDPEIVDSLLRFEEPAAALALFSTWRKNHEECLLVLDQFEELFTQNPNEVQAAFVELVGRLPLEANVHVVLSMRDDFLIHCQAHESLTPIFSRLTPIGAPTGTALRRAIVEPARSCGYRFEDEALVEEMIAEIEGERGSLPMLAFAVEKLWGFRDREHGVLTREAYRHVGGVGGALAQHAERTLAEIGKEKIPVVREIFRNLVTAKGTRARRSRHQLLSVFDQDVEADRRTDREPGSDPVTVLDALIDARLLTSYEIAGAETDREYRTEIEIIHESLLESWPRLERWQAQDADSAQLRDQLRQAAQLWRERKRTEDLLWSGTLYQEFEIWRERYPGGLSSEEEEFVAAMISHAERRERRRRILTSTVIISLVAGILLVGGLWQQAEIARDRSRLEALRAEANQLLALARVELEKDATAALAYVTASLGRTDSPAARRLAVETLLRGPSGLLVDVEGGASSLRFSPDGKWLAVGTADGAIEIWSRSGERKRLTGPGAGVVNSLHFGPESKRLVSVSRFPHVVRIWSIPDGEMVREIDSPMPLDARIAAGDDRVFVFFKRSDRVEVTAFPLGSGPSKSWGALPASLATWATWTHPWNLEVGASASALFLVESADGTDNRIVLRRTEGSEFSSAEAVGQHQQYLTEIALHPDGRQIASADGDGEIRIWRDNGQEWATARTLRHSRGLVRRMEIDDSGRFLATVNWSAGQVGLWRLESSRYAEPLIPVRGTSRLWDLAFSPDGSWLSVAGSGHVTLYPISRPYPQTLGGPAQDLISGTFVPNRNALAVTSTDGLLRVLSLSQSGQDKTPMSPGISSVVSAPNGEQLLVGTADGEILLVSLESGSQRILGTVDEAVETIALSSRLAAAAVWRHNTGSSIYIWNTVTGERQTLVLGKGANPFDLEFDPDGDLVVADTRGIHIWTLDDESGRTISEKPGRFDLSANGRLLLAAQQGANDEAALYDLEQGTSILLSSHGPANEVALSGDGRLVATVGEELRVGPASEALPHLLIDERPSRSARGRPKLEFSPDGTLLLSSGGKLVLWPVPDVTERPLQDLPHDELLSRLRSLTNLRVVEDLDSATGWSLHAEPFPGWETVPSW